MSRVVVFTKNGGMGFGGVGVVVSLLLAGLASAFGGYQTGKCEVSEVDRHKKRLIESVERLLISEKKLLATYDNIEVDGVKELTFKTLEMVRKERIDSETLLRELGAIV